MINNNERWTSSEAATSIDCHVGKIQRYLLDYLDACGEHGSTHQEAEQVFANVYGPSTIRARFAELERMGLVMESGEWRRTKAGRRALVWVSVTYDPRKSSTRRTKTGEAS